MKGMGLMKIRLKTIPCPLYGLGPKSTPAEWATAMRHIYLLVHLHVYDVSGRAMKIEEVSFTVHDDGGRQWTFTLFTGRDGDVAVREEGYGDLDVGELATMLAWWHVEIDWVGLTIGECVDKERSFIDNLFYGWEWLKSILSRNENFTVIKEKTK